MTGSATLLPHGRRTEIVHADGGCALDTIWLPPRFPQLDREQEAGDACARCSRPDPEIRVGETPRGNPVYACLDCAVAEFGMAEGIHWELVRP